MRVGATVVIVAMFVVAALPMASPPSTAETPFQLDTFGNGERSVIVSFPIAGMDDSNTLSLQTGLTIDDASMRISTVAPQPGSKDYPTNVSLDFGGDTVPEWQFKGANIGSLGRQTVFTTGQPKAQMEFKTMANNDSLAIRLPKDATVTSAKMNASMAAKGKIIAVYADPTPIYPQSLRDDLSKFSDEISVVDLFDASAATPTLDLLMGYSAAYVWIIGSSSYYGEQAAFKDRVALGNVMADYVDAGGGVVTASMQWVSSYSLSGRWTTGPYSALSFMGGYGAGGSPFSLSTIYLPDHPIMKDVKTVVCASGGPTGACTPTNGGQAVFKWQGSSTNDGAFVKTMDNGANRVDFQINAWPDTAPKRGNYGVGYSGDGNKLIKNSLMWTGRIVAGQAAPGVAMDILKDGIMEFNETTYKGNFTVPNMASAFNNYLATAPVAYIDPFGNEFVDVPINVTPNNKTTAIFDNLEVLYSLTADVDKNPVTGDLAASLGELTSAKPGNYNTTIPIIVSSSSPGRIKLQDLKLKMHAPFHKPVIKSFFPAAETVIKESSVLELGVNATDWYGLPIKYKWFYNDIEVKAAEGDRLTLPFGFQDAGVHAVRIVVSNEKANIQQSWNVMVQNVNRPPEITAFAPTSDPSILENSNVEFTVNTSDPDNDPIGYIWMLDGKGQGSASGGSFTYRTDFFSAGKHAVKVLAMDPGSLTAEHEWSVTVGNVDQPPLITDYEPKDDPTIIENQEQTFMVASVDSDNGALTTTWTVDGSPASTGNQFTFKTDYGSAGVRTVKATVSDGELSATREWKLTVLNLNRPPRAVIDSPRDSMETMQGPAIHFSGNFSSDLDGEQLSYTWKEGGAIVSDQAVFDMPFTHGFHTLVLEVRDRSGATNEATVHFRVRWVEFSLVLGLDKLDPSAGDAVGIIVTLRNVGDTGAKEQKLQILVDGKPVAGEDLPALAAGESARAQFQWKATKGAHTITAKLGDQTWNTPITVAGAKSGTAGPSANDYLWPVLIIVVAAGLVIWGRSALRKS